MNRAFVIGLLALSVFSSEVVRHVVKGADHGLGVFSDEPALTQEAVETTVVFLSARLQSSSREL